MKKTYFVYILKCRDTSYYTGVTNNLDIRLWQHNNDDIKSCYTYNKRPVKLVYSENYNDVNQAILREKQIKGWTRKKKEALIAQNYEKLPELSKSKNIKL